MDEEEASVPIFTDRLRQVCIAYSAHVQFDLLESAGSRSAF